MTAPNASSWKQKWKCSRNLWQTKNKFTNKFFVCFSDQSEKLNDAKNEIAELKEKLAGPETQASGEAAASAKEDTSVAPNDEACASTKDDLSLPAKDERKKIFDENLDVTAIFGESSKSPGNVHKELKRPSASTSSDGPPNKHSDGE